MTRRTTVMALGGGVTTMAFVCTLGLSQISVASASPKLTGASRAEQSAAMEQKHEEHLNQLVKDGKLTAAQKQLIIAKHKALKAEMEAKRTELEIWAKANNIPMEYLKMGHHGKRVENRRD